MKIFEGNLCAEINSIFNQIKLLSTIAIRSVRALMLIIGNSRHEEKTTYGQKAYDRR